MSTLLILSIVVMFTTRPLCRTCMHRMSSLPVGRSPAFCAASLATAAAAAVEGPYDVVNVSNCKWSWASVILRAYPLSLSFAGAVG